MIIHTTAEGISLSRKLETDSAAFYEAAASEYSQFCETFLLFVKENQKFITNIERAYYGLISDAIEGCFAFNLETDKYYLDTAKKPNTGATDLIKQAMQMEEKIENFYLEAGEQSKLMSDVSRSFILTAKKRQNRLTQLSELLNA